MNETALLIFTLSKNEFVLANIDIIVIADSKELRTCIFVYIPVCIVLDVLLYLSFGQMFMLYCIVVLSSL